MRLVLLACLASVSLLCMAMQPAPDQPVRPAIMDEPSIYGGEPADVDDWPWMASLDVVYENDLAALVVVCGGTMLPNNWIVTAAHCVEFFNSTSDGRPVPRQSVVAYYDSIDWASGASRVASCVQIHENYNGDDLTDDVALIKLAGAPIDLATFAGASGRTPRSLYDIFATDDFQEGAVSRIYGYGVTETGYISAPLLALQGRAYRGRHCAPLLGLICHYATETEYGSACFGDSGGPLVDDSSGKLLGVLSGGFMCGNSELPSIYTELAPYYGWIENVIAATDGLLPTGVSAAQLSAAKASASGTSASLAGDGGLPAALDPSTVVMPERSFVYLPALTRRYQLAPAPEPEPGVPVGSCLN